MSLKISVIFLLLVLSLSCFSQSDLELKKKITELEKILLENWLAQVQLSPQEKSPYLEMEKINSSTHSIEIPLPPPELKVYNA